MMPKAQVPKWEALHQTKITWPIIDEDEKYYTYDIHSDLVGKEAIIDSISEGLESYGLKIKGLGSSAWYSEDQLELISKNNNEL